MTDHVIYHELPAGSQNVRLWDMTAAQTELTGLAANLRSYGIEVRFKSDEIGESGLRFVKRVNAMIGLMDDHVLDFHRFHHSASPCGVSAKS